MIKVRHGWLFGMALGLWLAGCGGTAPQPGAACTPSCSGRSCGPDGCGGSCGGCDSNQVCGASGQCQSGPTLMQDFDPWTGVTSPDGIWRIAGVWPGTGGNTLDPANAVLSSTYGGATGGFLSLTSTANQTRGAEIQTLPGYGYGYYEVRMKVTPVPGVCASFFWIEKPAYGPHEWDVEFLTNESWISSSNLGKVHLTIHPSEQNHIQDLAFNPSAAFHRYGFLWVPGRIDFTIDGQVVHSFTDASLNTTVQGFIMMNSWTGSPTWGGGPPTQDATTVYDWVKFYQGATSIPQ